MAALLSIFLVSSCAAPKPTQLPIDTPTATIAPSPTATARPTITPRLIATRQPTATSMPDLDTETLHLQMQTSIEVNSINGFNSHLLQRVNGWSQGVEVYSDCHYRWLDDNHLLLSPITKDWGIAKDALPLVVTIKSRKIWFPATDEPSTDCSALWSQSLHRVVSMYDKMVLLYDVEGILVKSFEGKGYLNLSPSGLRLMVGLVWHDLQTGQTMDFSGQAKDEFYNPAWSADEKHLFNYGPAFADVYSEKFIDFEFNRLDPLAAEGEVKNRWVLNDTRVMIEWPFFDTQTSASVIPLIDPAAQTYIDVIASAGLNSDRGCNAYNSGTDYAPDGERMWVLCEKASYLIDLRTFVTQTLPHDLAPTSWSPDSRFILLANRDHDLNYVTRSGVYTLFLATNANSFPVSNRPVIAPIWGPDGKRLAYLSEDGINLVALNPLTRAITKIALDRTSTNIFWRPQGDGLAIQSSDGSLWYTPYPFADHVEQLTPPLPNVEAVKWSPDGSRIAFVSEPDVYIVSVSQP